MKVFILLAFLSITSVNAQVFKCFWNLHEDTPVYIKVDSLGVTEVDSTSYDCELSMWFYLVGWEMDTIIFEYTFYKYSCFLLDIKPVLSYFYEKKIKYATDRRCFVIKME